MWRRFGDEWWMIEAVVPAPAERAGVRRTVSPADLRWIPRRLSTARSCSSRTRGKLSQVGGEHGDDLLRFDLLGVGGDRAHLPAVFQRIVLGVARLRWGMADLAADLVLAST